MKNIVKFLCVIFLSLTYYMAYSQDIIFGSSPLYGTIQEQAQYFFDPGGDVNPANPTNPEGNFPNSYCDTMTLKTNLSTTNFVLYIYFDEFVMGYGDTMWIYDGANTNAQLIGFFNAVNSPGEIYATGSSLTFVFKSDDVEDIGLSSGWVARVSAYRKNANSFNGLDGSTNFTCNAKFYDSGGATGNIANNSENTSGTDYITFYSSADSHIKCEFTEFSVNGIMKIYDGPYVPGFPEFTGRLIGQFCTSTLDASTGNKPPVLFSSTNQLSFVYVGAANDKNKSGWAANITCVPELFESSNGSACPSVTNVPGGAYADSTNSGTTMHVIDFDCSKPVVLLEAKVVATGSFTNDYTVKSIPFESSIFSFTQGNSVNASSDDSWLSAVNLPFKFSFFGKTYTSVWPGTNGLIAMNNHSGSCAYAYGNPPASPPYSNISNNQTMGGGSMDVPYNYKNCIYGVYEDIDCNYYNSYNYGTQGAVKVGVLGSYPCRAFVFNYLNVGLYGNHSQPSNYNTYQMVIYEGTNIIDVFVKHRACCASTNSSRHEGIIGLQNSTSSQILLAPGRGMTGWTADEEAWRFTPITPLDEYGSLAWYENVVDEEHLLSFDSTAKNRRITVSPTQTTKIISVYKYTNATGDQFTLMDTTLIKVQIPEITASSSNGENFICPNQEVELSVEAANDFPNINPEHFLWKPLSASDTIDTLQTVTVSPIVTSNYVVTVTFDNGCTRNDTITVKVTELELPEITATRDTICIGESTTLVAQHPTSETFNWSTGQTSASITVSPQVTTLYTVSATMVGNCIVTDTLTVYVNNLPKPAFMANPTEIYVENGVGTVTCTDLSPENYNLTWNFGDIESATNIVQNVSMASHDYLRAGYYTITLVASDDNGCTDSIKSRVSVTVPYFFYIPNAFSPDANGVNEYFAPQGAGVDPDNYSMQIYDRNGMLIFNTRNPYDYWDGRNKYGAMCPEGVYVYIIRLYNLNGEDKEYTGSVTLIR